MGVDKEIKKRISDLQTKIDRIPERSEIVKFHLDEAREWLAHATKYAKKI